MESCLATDDLATYVKEVAIGLNFVRWNLILVIMLFFYLWYKSFADRVTVKKCEEALELREELLALEAQLKLQREGRQELEFKEIRAQVATKVAEVEMKVDEKLARLLELIRQRGELYDQRFGTLEETIDRVMLEQANARLRHSGW